MRRTMLLATAALLMAPTAAIAQNSADDIVYTDDTQREEGDDGNSRLGLLGLLGLAGLLGLRRREADIRVDARRDTRDDANS